MCQCLLVFLCLSLGGSRSRKVCLSVCLIICFLRPTNKYFLSSAMVQYHPSCIYATNMAHNSVSAFYLCNYCLHPSTEGKLPLIWKVLMWCPYHIMESGRWKKSNYIWSDQFHCIKNLFLSKTGIISLHSIRQRPICSIAVSFSSTARLRVLVKSWIQTATLQIADWAPKDPLYISWHAHHH